jgi:hypothetical protein
MSEPHREQWAADVRATIPDTSTEPRQAPALASMKQAADERSRNRATHNGFELDHSRSRASDVDVRGVVVGPDAKDAARDVGQVTGDCSSSLWPCAVGKFRQCRDESVQGRLGASVLCGQEDFVDDRPG